MMSKRKSSGAKTDPANRPATAQAKRQEPKAAESPAASPSILRHAPSEAAVRETIESIVIAFVLAFLFRTFEAEAFVIPTGSMAPTLMGRHKDVECPKCHYRYQVSASEEVDPRSGEEKGREHQVEGSTCPMCRYANGRHFQDPSFMGDRILVSKFNFEMGSPERWDVVVFKYPGDATTNYIKRLIGLPGENIRITHGDIFVQHETDGPFQIARKPPHKLLAMLQPVYDNDYLLPELTALGWPLRWQERAAGTPQWTLADEGRRFQTDGAAAGESWLRYRHLVPSYEQWQALERGRIPPPDQGPRPQLISDFTAYNTGRNNGNDWDRNLSYGSVPEPERVHWVGDLALECTLESRSETGQVVLELVKGGRRFQCRIDLATGRAAFSITGQDHFRPTALTAVVSRGKHQIRFSNIDRQLLLWVDNKLAAFDGPTAYELEDTRPTEADLSPAGIASQRAAVHISHVRIFRDLYYIADREGQWRRDFDEPVSESTLSDPAKWHVFDRMNHVDFPLGTDQFFVLGDNSARSKDSRLWGAEYFVKRELLIGEAMFIYWPHSWHKIPGTPIPFPYFPNFQRMGLVR